MCMSETQMLMLGVDTLRMVYPAFSLAKWSKREIREEINEQAKIVLEHSAPTVSENEGMKIPLVIMSGCEKQLDTMEEREVPSGCLSKEDMMEAIITSDYDTLDESPIGANVALDALLKEAEEEHFDLPEETVEYVMFNKSENPNRLKTRDEQKQEKILFLRLLA